MKRILLFSLLLILVSVPAAQAGKNVFGGAWNISAPTGDTGDFTSGLSFRGASLEWRHFYTRDMAYGFNATWDVFNEDFDGTATNPNFAITGKIWRYVNAAPMYLSWHRYLNGGQRGKRSFFGLNAGTAYIQRRTEVGIYQMDEDNWHLAVAPEIGMQMPWDSFLGWISVRYNYAFSAGDVDAQQWFEFRVGFGLD